MKLRLNSLLSYFSARIEQRKSIIQLLYQVVANYACFCDVEMKAKYHYQIMASSKRKTRNQPIKKRITGRISHFDTRSRIRSTCCKRASTPYQRQPYDSINIPQLVYELLTIDKYNHGNTIDT